MDYLECNGQIFTGLPGVGIFRRDINSGQKCQIPIKCCIYIKKVQFYPQDCSNFFVVLNQKYVFHLSNRVSEIDFRKQFYYSKIPIIFLFSLESQIYIITPFFIRSHNEDTILRFTKKLDTYLNVLFSERSYTTLSPYNFFTIYFNWLIQKKLVMNLSPPIMLTRILLYMDLFHLDLIYWYKLIFEKTKSPFISFYTTRDFQIIFLDGKKNIILLNFYNNSINLCDFSQKTTMICNTPSHLFFVTVESYNGMWYFYFYKECVVTGKIIFYFFHEHECLNLFQFKSILYHNGSFFLFYQSANQRITYDFLFVETEKLYKSLYWSTVTSFRLHEEWNDMHTMLKEGQSKMQNVLSISENKTIPKCCVCMENNVNLFFIPCGHCCCCHECHSKMEQNKCPVCREVIKYHRIIFT